MVSTIFTTVSRPVSIRSVYGQYGKVSLFVCLVGMRTDVLRGLEATIFLHSQVYQRRGCRVPTTRRACVGASTQLTVKVPRVPPKGPYGAESRVWAQETKRNLVSCPSESEGQETQVAIHPLRRRREILGQSSNQTYGRTWASLNQAGSGSL